jgi:hypothetical protein
LTVRWLPAPPSVTTPPLKFRLLLPVKVKFPFQFWALAVVVVTSPPVVLSIVPPLIVNAPTAVLPMAAPLLMRSVPSFSTRPPV